jgi:hypothetical protein
MTFKLCAVTAALCALFIAARPAAAHHSFASQFDANKKATLTGTVTKVEWTNPHIFFFIDVKDSDGKVAHWAIEGGSPNGLVRSGWTRNSLKIGDEVTVECFLARDGSNLANMSVVTMSGKKVLGRNPGPEIGR